MSLDPRALAAGLILAAAAAARRLIAGELTAEEYTQELQLLQTSAPELTFTARTIGTEPGKVLEANPSPRRRVVMQNQSTAAQSIRVASKSADLPGSGILLTPNAILIDEPPVPHGGEWYAASSAAGGVLVIAEQT